MLRTFAGLVVRDVQLALRQGSDTLLAVVFFVLATILFPFGVGPDPVMLAKIAPGVLWVTALLSALLSLERIFQADYDDGSLELLALQPFPLFGVVTAKVVAHWLTTALPLLAATPVLALLLRLETASLPSMLAALAVGTPCLSLIGAVGAALVLGARRSGVLLALLVLPLYIPVLVFGVGAVDSAASGSAVRPHLFLLAGLSLAALTLAPAAAAAAIRQALQ